MTPDPLLRNLAQAVLTKLGWASDVYWDVLARRLQDTMTDYVAELEEQYEREHP